MSLKVDLIPNSEKHRALGAALDELRAARGRHDPDYLALKALMSDLHSRMEMPRSNVLGEIERALQRTHASRNALGHDTGQLASVAYAVMKHWPILRQALEQFGELSAE